MFNWGKKPEADPKLMTLEEAKEKYPDQVESLDLMDKAMEEMRVPPEPPKDPESDLSTKPDDIVGYCFGYACPKKHTFGFFDSITLEGYNVRKPCPTCGGVSKPAVVKRTAEARWTDLARPSMWEENPEPKWGWYNSYSSGFGKSIGWGETCWTRYEFVHFLDSPKPAAKRRKK